MPIPPPDLLPWFVTRRIELTAVAVLCLVAFALFVFRRGAALSPREALRGLRVTLLVVLLGCVAVWGLETQQRREARRTWQRALHVAVTLISTERLDAEVSDAFGAAAERATRFMHDERKRHEPGGDVPFWLHAHGPVTVSRTPPRPPAEASLLERARFRYELGAYFADVDRRTHLLAGRHDVRIYVVAAEPRGRSARFVEGIGEAEGELGIVHVALDASMIDAAWTAVLHELLHTVGATDKYDAQGHPFVPAGLAEPALSPLYPQKRAEIMVGEIALAPGRGRLPSGLGEVRVGADTAREIGWR